MAAKKRKHRSSGRIFCLTLILTVALGSVILLGGWALAGVGSPELAAVRLESQLVGLIGEVQASAGSQAGADGQPGQTQGRYSAVLADEELCREQRIYAKETASAEETAIVFAGDILFDDRYAIMAKMKQRGQGIEGSISSELLDVMRGADIFMVNNEFPYTDRGTPTEGKKFTFRARPEYASYLSDMGADIVSLANNHAYDYGEVSLTDSIDTLNGIGMPFVGAGRNLEEAVKPVYFIANDQKIAFISATQIERSDHPDTKGATETSPGVFRCWNVDRLLEVVANAKQVSDYVIVYIHWGTESTDKLDWAQKEQAPKIAEAGADLIIGDHPHVLQEIGYCGDTPVFYSLGNYLFNSRAQDTCLVKLVLDAEGEKSLQFIPARQEDCSVTMLHGAEKERVLAYMRSISSGVSIDADGFVNKQ
ncbi:MAG: CapA family protein [Eubacteriales bacterium]|nr:CapA family protein [Eubacteriales bacterium]